VKEAEVMPANLLNAYKVMNADVLVLTENSLKTINDNLIK
jgi:large subunit ribosomal protein L4